MENAFHSDSQTAQSRPTYRLTRFLMLRLLGLIYAIGFLVAIQQILPLIGSNGLLPLHSFLSRVREALGTSGAGFLRLPSIFWLNDSDAMLLTMAWIGFLLSCLVVAGFANAIVMTVLWFLYMSFVHVGQDWYGYGWEIQLLETGFLAIFLCPPLDMRPFPKHPPPMPVITLFRFLIFRIMLGAGLIKIRGDEVWRNGTALYYHFETQPLPGPLSRWFHFFPRLILKVGVWYNFLAELVAPWFIFWPRIARHIAGTVIVFLQVILIFSGNLSFLNWLTIVPALACFDDGFWSKLLPRFLVRRAQIATGSEIPSRPMLVTSWILVVVIGLLSIQPLNNMLSPQQIMNTSFNRLDLVNTYGAFGSVGRERWNVVFEGTMDEASDDHAHWKEYMYKGLPVDLNKNPPQVAPFQLRLDWQMWFAAMSTPDEYPWTYHLIWKILHNDSGILGLFSENPFPGSPPKFIRAVLYQYRFVQPGNSDRKSWSRERVSDPWIPPLSAADPRLLEILRNEGWVQ